MQPDRLVRWEFTHSKSFTNNPDGLVQKLSEFGLDRWDLVGFAAADRTLGLNNLIAILKRPLPHPPTPDDTDAGWKQDPLGADTATERYWDGDFWTIHERGGTETGMTPLCRRNKHSDCTAPYCSCRCHLA